MRANDAPAMTVITMDPGRERELTAVDIAHIAQLLRGAINVDGKQTQKIFFVPDISVLDGDSERTVRYRYPDGAYGVWAGRVLPGQSLDEGVAEALDEVLHYLGRFSIHEMRHLDTARDNNGNDIDRYGFAVVLHDKLLAKTAKGMTIELTAR